MEVSQPIAQNAFGRSTRLLDQIVGLEVDVARYQVIEAYEDYLSTVIVAYYDWYAAYQNLKIGQASYKENLKLLDHMGERQKQKIALPIDVNKVKLQVLSRKERLVELEERYTNATHKIQTILRDFGQDDYIPFLSRPLAEVNTDFEKAYQEFRHASRTFDVLRMLEETSKLEVSRSADDLLPSIVMNLGYTIDGEGYRIRQEDDLFYAGVTLQWPLFDQVDRAEHEVAKIDFQQQQLLTNNTHFRLLVQLRTLYFQIQREQKLITLADERIQLAQSVLKDEEENYSFGKVTLNDYIQAFNALDDNRFNKIAHEVSYRKLIAEWLRLTDRLVQAKKEQGQLVPLQISQDSL